MKCCLPYFHTIKHGLQYVSITKHATDVPILSISASAIIFELAIFAPPCIQTTLHTLPPLMIWYINLQILESTHIFNWLIIIYDTWRVFQLVGAIILVLLSAILYSSLSMHKPNKAGDNRQPCFTTILLWNLLDKPFVCLRQNNAFHISCKPLHEILVELPQCTHPFQ